MCRCLLPVLVASVLCSGGNVRAAPVKHPNLLLNREEIAEVKAKIARYEWARALFEKVKELARDGSNVREMALCYVLTDDKQYADRTRAQLLSQARYDMGRFANLDLTVEPEAYAWTSWSTYAWAYDLTYCTARAACFIPISTSSSTSPPT
jgi:hypothetical protein